MCCNCYNFIAPTYVWYLQQNTLWVSHKNDIVLAIYFIIGEFQQYMLYIFNLFGKRESLESCQEYWNQAKILKDSRTKFIASDPSYTLTELVRYTRVAHEWLVCTCYLVAELYHIIRYCLIILKMMNFVDTLLILGMRERQKWERKANG